MVESLDRVSVGLSKIDAVLLSGNAEAQRSIAMRQAILRSAFSGMLVSQDPTDEPASILLERIAAERGAINSAPKRGRKPDKPA